MKELGPLRYFFGLEVARNNDRITLCQRNYALDLLSEAGYLGCKSFFILIEPNLKIFKEDGELLGDVTSYRRLIGSYYI